jgi:hypothetical protein
MAESHMLACRPGQELPTSATSARPSLLLALPPEVRLGIYEFLFDGGMIHVDAPKDCNCAACSFDKCKTDHRILLTCRLCRNEGRSTLFSSTLWIFPTPAWSSLRAFTSSPRSSEGSRVVKYISLDLISLEAQRTFDGLPSLEDIIVRTNGLAYLQCIARRGFDTLSDEDIAFRVHKRLLRRDPLLTLGHIVSQARTFSLSLLVKLAYLRLGKVIPSQWHSTACRTLLPGVCLLTG